MKCLGDISGLLCLWVTDGVFGRCQWSPGVYHYTYDESPEALQRLRNALQKLAHQGYTWKDDVTQEMISRDLLEMPRAPVQHLSLTFPPSSRCTNYAQKDRTLHRYLQELGFLSADVTSSKQSLQEQVRAHARPPPLPLSSTFIQPASKHFHPALPPPSRLGPDRMGLLASIQRYLSRLRAQLTRPSQMKVQDYSFQRMAPPRREKAPSASRQPPRPRTDKLLFGSVRNRPAPKDSLSSVDEKFIQGVAQQLWRKSVSVDTLTPSDLDQLSELIAQTLQMVDGVKGAKGDEVTDDEEGIEEVEMKRESVTAEKQVEKTGEEVHSTDQPEENAPKSDEKDDAFISQLLKFLNRNSEAAAPAQDEEVVLGHTSLPARPAGMKAGWENVQSRTTQSDLDLVKKTLESDTVLVDPVGDTEIEQHLHWEDSPPRDEGSLPTNSRAAEPHKKLEKYGPRLEETSQRDVATYSSPPHDGDLGYVITEDSLSTDQGLNLMEILADRVHLHVTDFLQLSVLGPAVTFRVRPNVRNITTALLTRVAVEQKRILEKESGVKILEVGLSDRTKMNQIPIIKHSHVEPNNFLVLTMVSMAFVAMVLGLSGALFCMRYRSHYKLKERLASLGTDTSHDATAAYQDLCRQRMAVQTSERAERGSDVFHPTHTSRINSVSSQFSDGATQSPSARSSTSSWSEEPAQTNMDISTGHMILSYMEDHLLNRQRLEKEWEALCSYQAEPASHAIAQDKHNTKKNRANGMLAYDHSRVILKAENNHSNGDYINASLIMDHDPRNPVYISAQAPLPCTVSDFWQMVWESGCVVIVMLTPLAENGTKQCHQYWPDEGSDLYHIYEVNLVSEHIWCEDFLVRSFYLKNVQTNETRTVTQFHFLSWMDQSVPESARTLLDFRRKVNKCYRGRSCPIIIHCSDGSGRCGSYILIDMVLNKMAKGAKEIDIAATLEHLRDQRAGMVHTKDQFEFALTAVAEEVNAILKALPQ
uniref:Protein tyrosine phosphatase receptor type N2 n=1 Tax=Electrophorus electricus TaxID=8005 RepID=A0AAY5EZL6_ELEEL